MCLGRNILNAVLYFGCQNYANSKGETILGIIIDNKITFYGHITGLCERDLSKAHCFIQDYALFRFIIKKHYF